MPVPVDQIVSLKGLQRLQFLTFHVTYVGVKEWERGFRAVDILKNPSITHSLKELTIGFVTYLENLVDSDWRDIYDSKVWKDLDYVLSSIPTLQRVHIYFDIESGHIPPQFWAGIWASMPLLKEWGILTLEEGYIKNLEREIWLIEE
jgi:hypothetical protein